MCGLMTKPTTEMRASTSPTLSHLTRDYVGWKALALACTGSMEERIRFG